MLTVTTSVRQHCGKISASSNDGGEKKMRKFAAFWTRMRRKRREGRNKVPVNAIDEMSLKSAEASVMCKRPTGGVNDKQ